MCPGDLREPTNERANGDLALKTAERSPQAAVRALAEGHVAVVPPGRVETIRIDELCRVTAVRAEHEQHVVPPPQALPAKVDFLGHAR